jgi:hypothetical protein
MTEKTKEASFPYGWGSVYRLADYDDVIVRTYQPGHTQPGIAFLTPAAVEQTFRHNVWDRLNERLGTWFSYAEEEDLEDPTAIRAVSAALRKEAAQAKDNEARRVLSEAADLLDESAESGQAVVVSL